MQCPNSAYGHTNAMARTCSINYVYQTRRIILETDPAKGPNKTTINNLTAARSTDFNSFHRFPRTLPSRACRALTAPRGRYTSRRRVVKGGEEITPGVVMSICHCGGCPFMCPSQKVIIVQERHWPLLVVPFFFQH